MHKKTAIWATAAMGLLAAGGTASGYEVRIRFVERVGNTDVVIAHNEIDFSDGSARRIRMQIGVFDDAAGPAPAGGVVGWVNGSIATSHVGRRTPGRLGVFAFPAGTNGEPAADPFLRLTGIDAVLQPQSLPWECNGGNPAPMPTPVIRGVNTYVSVWEATLDPEHCGNANVEFSGEILVATRWDVVGQPTPPSCSAPPTPGSVVYAPVVESRVPFTSHLNGGMTFPPNCMSDWNYDRQLTSEDFFLFLTDFFGGTADFNCDTFVNSEDFFGFLAEFFAGC